MASSYGPTADATFRRATEIFRQTYGDEEMAKRDNEFYKDAFEEKKSFWEACYPTAISLKLTVRAKRIARQMKKTSLVAGGVGFAVIDGNNALQFLGGHFVAGKCMNVKLCHQNMFAVDDAMLDARVALIKIEGQGLDEKLDLYMITGRISPFHNMYSMENFVHNFWNDDGMEGDSREWIMQSRMSYVCAVECMRRAPSSYADQEYYTPYVYRYTTADGNRCLVKFRLIPKNRQAHETGGLDKADEEAPWFRERRSNETREVDYLKKEFNDRLFSRTIQYRLQVQTRGVSESDDVNVFNMTVSWPESTYPWVNVAEVVLTSSLPEKELANTRWSLDHHPAKLVIPRVRSLSSFTSCSLASEALCSFTEKLRQHHLGQHGADSSAVYIIVLVSGATARTRTKSQLKVILTGTDGQTTRTHVQHRFKQKSEEGRNDVFVLRDAAVGKVLSVQIDWTPAPMQTFWLLDHVVLLSLYRNEVYSFPCQRWFHEDNRSMILRTHHSALSHRDTDQYLKLLRQQELCARKDTYQWESETDGRHASLISLRSDISTFSLDSESSTANLAMVKSKPTDSEAEKEGPELAPKRIQILKSGKLPGHLYHPHWHLELKSTFKSTKSDLNIQGFLKNESWTVANQLDGFFRHVAQSTNAKISMWNNAWLDDIEFGRQYLCGVYPFELEPVKLDSRNLPMERKLIESLLDEGVSFSDAVVNGRLYVASYKGLQNLPRTKGRHVTDPVCVLYVNEARDLIPICIKYHHTKEKTEVWTCADNAHDWLLAKLHVRCAHVHYHVIKGLLFHHMLLETMIGCLLRNLAAVHPLHKLLWPVFREVVLTSCLLRKSSKYSVMSLLAIDEPGIKKVLKDEFSAFDLGDWTSGILSNADGVHPPQLSEHEFSHDSKLLCDAIREFVGKYLQTYYRDDLDVQMDTELQAFIAELLLCVHDCSGNRETGPKYALSSLQQLEGFVSRFMFSISVQRPAVLSKILECYSHPGMSPTFMREPPSGAKDVRDMSTIFSSLPNKRQASRNVVVMHALSKCIPEQVLLGDLDEQQFANEEAQAVIKAFRSRVQNIYQTIVERNKKIENPYIGVLPPYLRNI